MTVIVPVPAFAWRAIVGYPVAVDFSPIQIGIVLIIALVVFGPKRLPELGRQVGRSLREAKKQMSQLSDEVSRVVDVEDLKSEPPTKKAPAGAPALGPRETPLITRKGAAVTAEAAAESDDDLLDGVLITRQADDGALPEGPTAMMQDDTAPDDDPHEGVTVDGETPPGSPPQD